MREVTTTMYCDRCGKNIENTADAYTVELYPFVNADLLYGEGKDLCADCMESFEKWMEQGKSKR